MAKREFTVKEGLQTALRDVGHCYCSLNDSQRKQFLSDAADLLARKIKDAKSGYDVPRGTSLEKLCWLSRGKSVEEYQKYLESYD